MKTITRRAACLGLTLSSLATTARAIAPQVPDIYYIYYEPDDKALEPMAQEALDFIAKRALELNYRRLIITGHADTLASTQRSLTLSKRWARLVADYLAAKGFDRARMDVSWHGEDQPVIQTGDGVSEPLNRRVQVEIVD